MALRGQPRAVRVSRWPGSFPQYRPGHLGRVAAIEADLTASAQRVALAGAALRGLGVPACIRQGRAAAGQLLDALAP
jgi:oxygen-dependent protoporphyrinogen oxidase